MKAIAAFLSWAAVHKDALLCYSTDDCECPWVDYSEEELEALLQEYEARKEALADEARS